MPQLANLATLNKALNSAREKPGWTCGTELTEELRVCSWAMLRTTHAELARELLQQWRGQGIVKADPLAGHPRTWESIQQRVRPGHVATLLRQLRRMGKLEELGDTGAMKTISAVRKAAKAAALAKLLNSLRDAGELALPAGLDLHVWATLRRLAPTHHFFVQVITRAVKVWSSNHALETFREHVASSRAVLAARCVPAAPACQRASVPALRFANDMCLVSATRSDNTGCLC